MRVKSCLLLTAVALGLWVMAAADPLHAECKVIWLFGIPCREVFVALVNQIKAWRTESGCTAGGEKCLYELVSARPLLITAKHTSRRRDNVEDLSFALRPTEQDLACRVTGVSTSESWFMLADNGTNYCTLYNLIEGSGLVDAEGYKQYTNEWICLDYFTANCTIY
ncbi:uncharacterized protein wu:fc46h12 [Colossoma macropomum]|uniref:uncharacterized protein wu:fc46h12 n=1 Tax=Colossoma macropomum TaxID=42526 RepID=UPI001863D34B|nr:uncharacterized protein wu:fc46h12 [Colossoma macropomum]